VDRESLKSFMQATAKYDDYRTLHMKCLMALSTETLSDLLTTCEEVMHDESEEMSERLVHGLCVTAALGLMLDKMNEVNEADRG
jgi:hypothetical protein